MYRMVYFSETKQRTVRKTLGTKKEVNAWAKRKGIKSFELWQLVVIKPRSKKQAKQKKAA